MKINNIFNPIKLKIQNIIQLKKHLLIVKLKIMKKMNYDKN